MEDDERREDEQQHRRQRVARAQLKHEILPSEHADVDEVTAHASDSSAVASGATRVASCVATRNAARPRRDSSSRSRSRAPSASSALYGSSSMSSTGSGKSNRHRASPCNN